MIQLNPVRTRRQKRDFPHSQPEMRNSFVITVVRLHEYEEVCLNSGCLIFETRVSLYCSLPSLPSLSHTRLG